MIPKSIAAILPVGEGEQVSVMQIGVEETVDHCLAKESADQDRGERAGVMAGGDQGIAVIEFDSVEPFEGQHPPGGSPPVDLGDVITGLGDHVLAQLGGRGAFALEVELARGPLPEMGDDQARPQTLGFSAEPLDMRSGPLVGLDRPGEVFLDAGPQDLDRDLFAFAGDGAVHLGDRRGADRLGVELAVQALERHAERAFDGLS